MRHSLLLLALGGTLAACQPQAEPSPASSPATDALLALRARYGVPAQYYTYNPQRVEVFRTAGGGALALGSRAFLDIASSEPVAGPLQLEVREIRTRSEMLLSGRPSMAQGAILESGGHYLVQAATPDRRLLWLSPRVKLGLAVSTPAGLTSPYGLFLYAPTQPGNADSPWQPATDTASSVRPTMPLSAGDPIYLRCLIAKGLYDSNNGWLSFAHPLYSAAAPLPCGCTPTCPQPPAARLCTWYFGSTTRWRS